MDVQQKQRLLRNMGKDKDKASKYAGEWNIRVKIVYCELGLTVIWWNITVNHLTESGFFGAFFDFA